MSEIQNIENTDAPAEGLSGPTGIGGWMILPMIGMVLIMASTGYNIFLAVAAYDGIILILTGAFDMAFKIAILGSLILGLILIGTAIASLYQIFRHDRRTPATVTVHYFVLVLVAAFEFWADKVTAGILGLTSDPTILKTLVSSFLAAGIWIAYFRNSKRSKNTFVK